MGFFRMTVSCTIQVNFAELPQRRKTTYNKIYILPARESHRNDYVRCPLANTRPGKKTFLCPSLLFITNAWGTLAEICLLGNEDTETI